MGNCQAAEAATVVIQHPGANKIERIYWSVGAHEVMTSNPGHYVALVVNSPTMKSETGVPLKQLKLLRPDDTLLIGQVYRLISFEDVLKEFAAKKSVKLGKLLKDRGGLGVEVKMNDLAVQNLKSRNNNSIKKSSIPMVHGDAFTPLFKECQIYDDSGEMESLGSNCGSKSTNNGRSYKSVGRNHGGGGGGEQWRPALQSIAEVGT